MICEIYYVDVLAVVLLIMFGLHHFNAVNRPLWTTCIFYLKSSVLCTFLVKLCSNFKAKANTPQVRECRLSSTSQQIQFKWDVFFSYLVFVVPLLHFTLKASPPPNDHEIRAFYRQYYTFICMFAKLKPSLRIYSPSGTRTELKMI